MRYLEDGKVKLWGYTYSYWEGDVTNMNIISGCCFSLGSIMIYRFNMKQTSMELSSSEVEYMEASTSICEAIWLYKFLAHLFDQELVPTMIYCDNKSCIIF